MVDLKALMGDASDNIPGVPGIGEKTALISCAAMAAVEDIYANLRRWTSGTASAKLDAGRESAKMSYTLATISREAPWSSNPPRRPGAGTSARTLEVLNRLGFRKPSSKSGASPPRPRRCRRGAEPRPALRYSPISARRPSAASGAAATVGISPGGDLDSLMVCDGEGIFTPSWAELGEDYNRLLRLLFSGEVKNPRTA